VILLVLIGFLQLLLTLKILIYVIGPVGTNSNDLVLLARYIFADNTALDVALTQLQFPSLVASFIFLAFACLSAAERFLAPGSSTY
jgi:hypothetical protein